MPTVGKSSSAQELACLMLRLYCAFEIPDSHDQSEGGLTMRSIKSITLIGAMIMALGTTSCATVGGAVVGAGAGAAIGAGTGHGAGNGALVGGGIGAAAGAIHDITH